MFYRFLVPILSLMCFLPGVSVFAKETKPFPSNVVYTLDNSLQTFEFPDQIDKVMENAALAKLVGNGRAVTISFNKLFSIFG